MKHILFLGFSGCLAILGCSSAKKFPSSVVTQGITGRITELTGNRMPMKDAEPDLPKPLLTTVFIYEPTHISQVTRTGTEPVYTAIATRLVASVETDSTGHFTVSLPVGSYSLFVKQGDRFYANLFDNNNHIALFPVEEGKLTQANLSVSNRASF
ncbi:MAG: carboxypeptidase regulatory-like domain-containing protein [Bacteroidetes bacterium]|nr:carboxypeptidase regulatory-like domain-containing protein [Bacteroidota bacterium]